MRPGRRWVHSVSLGSFGCALRSLGSLGYALVVVGFILVYALVVVGFIRGSWSRLDALWGSFWVVEFILV